MTRGFTFCEDVNKGVNGVRKLDANHFLQPSGEEKHEQSNKNMEVFDISWVTTAKLTTV